MKIEDLKILKKALVNAKKDFEDLKNFDFYSIQNFLELKRHIAKKFPYTLYGICYNLESKNIGDKKIDFFMEIARIIIPRLFVECGYICVTILDSTYSIRERIKFIEKCINLIDEYIYDYNNNLETY